MPVLIAHSMSVYYPSARNDHPPSPGSFDLDRMCHVDDDHCDVNDSGVGKEMEELTPSSSSSASPSSSSTSSSSTSSSTFTSGSTTFSSSSSSTSSSTSFSFPSSSSSFAPMRSSFNMTSAAAAFNDIGRRAVGNKGTGLLEQDIGMREQLSQMTTSENVIDGNQLSNDTAPPTASAAAAAVAAAAVVTLTTVTFQPTALSRLGELKQSRDVHEKQSMTVVNIVTPQSLLAVTSSSCQEATTPSQLVTSSFGNLTSTVQVYTTTPGVIPMTSLIAEPVIGPVTNSLAVFSSGSDDEVCQLLGTGSVHPRPVHALGEEGQGVRGVSSLQAAGMGPLRAGWESTVFCPIEVIESVEWGNSLMSEGMVLGGGGGGAAGRSARFCRPPGRSHVNNRTAVIQRPSLDFDKMQRNGMIMSTNARTSRRCHRKLHVPSRELEQMLILQAQQMHHH